MALLAIQLFNHAIHTAKAMSKEIDTIQGSPEWWKARRGIPTGSQFSRIITAKKGDYATGSKHYQAELIAEALGWQSGFKAHQTLSEATLWSPRHCAG